MRLAVALRARRERLLDRGALKLHFLHEGGRTAALAHAADGPADAAARRRPTVLRRD